VARDLLLVKGSIAFNTWLAPSICNAKCNLCPVVANIDSGGFVCAFPIDVRFQFVDTNTETRYDRIATVTVCRAETLPPKTADSAWMRLKSRVRCVPMFVAM
jgi:hypothetical protein